MALLQTLLWEECRSEAPRSLPVAAGLHHSAFVDTSGRLLMCSRTRSEGAVAWEPTPLTPVRGLAAVRVTSVSSSSSHTLAVTATGAVYAFGKNCVGQLGLGDLVERRVACRIDLLECSVVQVSCGCDFSLAMTSTGEISGWGNKSAWYPGHHIGTDAHATPAHVEMPTRDRMWAVATGFSHCLTLTEEGAVYGWGKGSCGQHGHGHIGRQNTPLRVKTLERVRVRAVAAGGHRSLAVSDAGVVYWWGISIASSMSTTPVVMKELTHVTVRTATTRNGVVYVVSEEGAVHRYGPSVSSGNVVTEIVSVPLDEAVPTPSEGEVRVKAVLSGPTHALAVLENGTVCGWGDMRNWHAAPGALPAPGVNSSSASTTRTESHPLVLPELRLLVAHDTTPF